MKKLSDSYLAGALTALVFWSIFWGVGFSLTEMHPKTYIHHQR